MEGVIGEFYCSREGVVYNLAMKKTLLETNPYLKDAKVRERTMARNIESSSAVEGIWIKRDSATGRFVSKKSDMATRAVRFEPVKKTS